MYRRRRAWLPAASAAAGGGEWHLSNTVVGLLNLVTLVASVPMIGAGLWLQSHGGGSCGSALQAPLLAVGLVTLLVSLAGFAGACYHLVYALWLYLAAMLVLVLALLGVTVFGLAVTAGGGGGAQVPGRPYREFRLADYSAWLQRHVRAEKYWRPALACVVAARACDSVAAWTPMDYLSHDLTPIQSGCCKPPTSCTYEYDQQPQQSQPPDCFRWSNSPGVLCYGCDSCKAGVLEQLRRHWHNVTILNVVLLLLLIALYSCACCAFRNAATAMPAKNIFHLHPRWSRWWHGRS